MNELAILAQAIRDVGTFRWWTEAPGVLQLEFGAVQLLLGEPTADRAPPSVLALRIDGPTAIGFATFEGDEDWPEKLAADAIAPEHVDPDELAFDPEARAAVLSAPRLRWHLGSAETCDGPVSLAFRTGSWGVVVTGAVLRVFSATGEIALAEIPALSQAWWAYWRRYWDQRDTPDALPRDFACEVTIPLKGP